MISEVFAKQQITRFPRLPESATALRDLVQALISAAQNEAHAADIVGRLIQRDANGFIVIPLPSEIARIGFETRQDASEHAGGCVGCGGRGWRIVQRVLPSGPWAGELRDYAVACDCRPKPPVEDRRLAAAGRDE